MKKFFRFIGTVIAVFFAGILGNVIGDQIRAQVTQTSARVKVSSFDEETKETTYAIQPFITNILPAWLAGALLKPHWFWALLVGGLAGGLLSDRYEQQFEDLLKQMNPSGEQSVEDEEL